MEFLQELLRSLAVFQKSSPKDVGRVKNGLFLISSGSN